MAYKNDPQARVAPDANVWLDAAFCPECVARRSLERLRADGKQVILEELTECEVLKILAQRRLALGLGFDPAEHFSAYASGYLRVPPAPAVAVKTNRADSHIARTAIHYQATIVTGDAPLLAQCLADNILAKFPWSIVLQDGETPLVEEILRIVPPTRRKGTIFARVTPGGWAGKLDVGEFTVVDIENIGRLFFNSKSEEWIFDSAIAVRLRFPLSGRGTTIVCASYNLPAYERGNVVVRACCQTSSTTDSKSESTLKGLKAEPGEIRIGATRDGHFYWNGSIRHLTVSPEGMSANKWRPIAEVADAAPNPMNRDALDLALLRMLG